MEDAPGSSPKCLGNGTREEKGRLLTRTLENGRYGRYARHWRKALALYYYHWRRAGMRGHWRQALALGVNMVWLVFSVTLCGVGGGRVCGVGGGRARAVRPVCQSVSECVTRGEGGGGACPGFAMRSARHAFFFYSFEAGF